MGKIIDILNKKRLLVSDGAWGTLLQQKGLGVGECPELWNITHENHVYEIAESYANAGADLIKTNSFGANRYKLELFGCGDKVKEINIAAASISKKAAGKNKYVIASVGPTGKILMMGDVTEADLYNAYKEQVTALAEGGADAILIETMSDTAEAVAAIRAVKENTSLEAIATMTFEYTLNNEFRTMMGVSPEEMLGAFSTAGADIVGANCGKGIEEMIKLVKEFRNINSEIPLIVHPNAGLPVYVDGKTTFPGTPEEMAMHIEEMIRVGANIIGGCCGTSPAHIKKIADIVKKFQT